MVIKNINKTDFLSIKKSKINKMNLCSKFNIDV